MTRSTALVGKEGTTCTLIIAARFNGGANGRPEPACKRGSLEAWFGRLSRPRRACKSHDPRPKSCPAWSWAWPAFGSAGDHQAASVAIEDERTWCEHDDSWFRFCKQNAPGSEFRPEASAWSESERLLRHVFEQLQCPHLDLVVGGLGRTVHQLAGLERVRNALLSLAGRNLLLLDLH